jgi:indole-3-glycerol phosphate synthase
MDRRRWLQEKREEVSGLHGLGLSEITPSRRDFALYVATQRQELALIARAQRADPVTGQTWPGRDLAAFAVACDDAEVAALAVATDRQRDGSLALLRSVAEATTAPILRDDLTLDQNQLYDARLHGADAAIFPASELAADTLGELVRLASSLHMASVIEVQRATDLAKALACGKALIGIDADLDATLSLANDVPSIRTVIALRDPGTLADVRCLRTHVDAVVVGPLLLNSDNLSETVAAVNR